MSRQRPRQRGIDRRCQVLVRGVRQPLLGHVVELSTHDARLVSRKAFWVGAEVRLQIEGLSIPGRVVGVGSFYRWFFFRYYLAVVELFTTGWNPDRVSDLMVPIETDAVAAEDDEELLQVKIQQAYDLEPLETYQKVRELAERLRRQYSNYKRHSYYHMLIGSTQWGNCTRRDFPNREVERFVNTLTPP